MSNASNSSPNVYEFIIEAGIKLETKATTLATAAVLFYRFEEHSSKQKLKGDERFCRFTVAAACLALAGKIEENHLKIRDVINVSHRILHPDDDEPLEIDEHYWNVRQGLGDLEMLLLRTIGFQINQFSHPHKFLLCFVKALEEIVPAGDWQPANFAQTCWTMLRDAYLSPAIILEHRPQCVAAAIIFIVAQLQGVELLQPEDKFGRLAKQCWYQDFCGRDFTEEKLLAIADKISGVYVLHNNLKNTIE